MIGHIHPQDLRGADQKRALRARRVGRDAAVEQPRQHMAERAQSAEYRRHQPSHQGAIAIGERLQPGMGGGAFKQIVKRAVLVQHAVHDIRRDPPRRETGHFGRSSESLRRHAGTLLGRVDSLAKIRRIALTRQHLCHADMPDIRTASGFFTPPHDLLTNARLLGLRVIGDERRSFTADCGHLPGHESR